MAKYREVEDERGKEERGKTAKSGSPKQAALLLTIALGIAFTWWGLLHEVSFYYMATYEAQADNCFVGFLGGSAAGVAMLLLRRFTNVDLTSRAIGLAWLGVDCVLMIVFYVLLQRPQTYGFATLCYFFLNVSFYYFVACCIVRFSAMDFTRLTRSLFVAGAIYACLELALQPLFFSGQLWAFSIRDDSLIVETHLALLVVSLVFALKGSAELRACEPLEDTPVEYRPFKPAIQLLIVALFYSIVFGMIHNLASGIVDEPSSKILPSHIGLLMGAVVFLITFSAGAAGMRIWARMRQVVFPITMIGFIFLPLSHDYLAAVSVVAGECATINFYLVFLLSCVAISKRSQFDPLKVGALGIAVSAAGFFAGDFLSSAVRTAGLLNVSAFVFLTAFAFVLLIAATFWTGDDRSAALLWGMEEKRAPRKYDDERSRQRAESLIERYGLSAREGEILHMFAQEKSPQQVTEELFISMATVRSHTHKIHVKLGIHSHAELMALIKGSEGEGQ